ncbi:16S rRNA (guanine(966)-N(2))-methyltransferase RsmD [Candidatus Kinetoplastidibacterium desouzai]|nr:16S rRNA (guanine(966)-N(2))-methyltransferase RsmD [Candidatus Kinetoplastibacterium desouzaii]
MNNSVHIISGIYKNTKIKFPNAQGLRPTSNRVKETLFNWISNQWNHNFTNKHILDLFAGSGSLGFEAASRGVKFIQMVEKNKLAVNFIKTICKNININNISIYQGDSIDFLCSKRKQNFDLVLLDPPFKYEHFEKIWHYLPNILKDGCLVYIESDSIVKTPSFLHAIRNGKAGLVNFSLSVYKDNNINLL